MKKTLAVAAGIVLAFGPTGAAFADTPGGNAFGNCGNNAAGGDKDITLYGPGAGNGLGGHVASRGACGTSDNDPGLPTVSNLV